MKRKLKIPGLAVLVVLVLVGCKCPFGTCPFSKGDKLCGCGAPKGSAECAAACKKPAGLCKCGAPKGSAACAAACKK